MLMTIADRMLLIGKKFANEGFLKYLNTLQVACTVFWTAYTNNMCRKVRAFNALLPLIISESMYRTISRQKV